MNRGTGSVHDDFLSADVRQRKVSGGFRRFQRVSGGQTLTLVSGFKFQEVSEESSSGGVRRFQVSGCRFQVSEGFRFQDSGFKGKHIDYENMSPLGSLRMSTYLFFFNTRRWVMQEGSSSS